MTGPTTTAAPSADLLASAPAQSYLAHLLGYQQPEYVHVPLVVNAEGKRLAKRDDARALALYRAEGRTPDDIRQMIGLDSSTSAPSRTAV